MVEYRFQEIKKSAKVALSAENCYYGILIQRIELKLVDMVAICITKVPRKCNPVGCLGNISIFVKTTQYRIKCLLPVFKVFYQISCAETYRCLNTTVDGGNLNLLSSVFV